MNANARFDDEQVLHGYRAAADRLMIATMGFLLLVTLGISAFTGTWTLGLAVGVPAFLVPFAIYHLAPGSLVSRLVIAAAFMVYSALSIQQMRGMIEMHFGIFALLAFLLYYRDWRPIVAAAAVIAVHHLAFNYLQAADLGFYVFIGGPSLGLVIVHALYVVFESAVLVYLAVNLRSESLEIARVAAIAESIGQGNLVVEEANPKEPLVRTVVGMQQQLAGTIHQVEDQAGAVSAAALSLDSISQSVSARTQEQSDATSAIAASIQELTVTINHLADEASEAWQLATESGDLSRDGTEVVSATVSEMGHIATTIQESARSVEQLGEQSDRVAAVVGLIKDIADQTNLLALNAAIEAARAGEQGRGFAVVADEVRKLAERTTHATAEIDGMMHEIQTRKTAALSSIADAVEKVEVGSQRAAEAGTSINTISQEATRVQGVIKDISDALKEQSAATQDIAKNVERISLAAETSEQAAGSMLEEIARLKTSASSLSGAVSHFRLA